MKRSYHESSKSWKARKKREREERAHALFRRKMRKPAFWRKVLTRMTNVIVNAQPSHTDLLPKLATKMRSSTFEHCDWQSDPKFALWQPALTLQAHARGYKITDPG
jgi:hypothetical protein